ncbi:MAG: hypothetical protein RR075_03255, partial [Pygmaiobacter sp.]
MSGCSFLPLRGTAQGTEKKEVDEPGIAIGTVFSSGRSGSAFSVKDCDESPDSVSESCTSRCGAV